MILLTRVAVVSSQLDTLTLIMLAAETLGIRLKEMFL